MRFSFPPDGWGTITPRRWQKAGLDLVLKHFNQTKPKRALIRAVCGAGKGTFIAQIVACADFKPDEVLVVTAPTIFLVKQLRDTIQNRIGPVGVYYTSEKDLNHRIIVACTASLLPVAQTLRARKKRCAFWLPDECHLATEAVGLREAHSYLMPELTMGLSVGPESSILVKEETGHTKRVSIAEFCDPLIQEREGEFVPVTGLSTRAFNGKSFVWKPIKSIFKHRLNKKAFKITTKFGRVLTLTEDHSTYRIQNKCGSPTLEEVQGSCLQVGDYLLLEEFLQEPEIVINSLDMQDYIIGDNWLLASPSLEKWVRSKYKRGKLFDRKNGKHGWFVSSQDLSQMQPKPSSGLLYREGRGLTCTKHLPVSSIAYLIGFYLGDGWVHENKTVFAVEDIQVDSFLLELGNLAPYVEINPKVKPAPGKGQSFEISICNKFLTDFFKSTIKGKCWEKRVPSIVFQFSTKNVKEVLRGLQDSDGCLTIKDRSKERQTHVTTSFGLALDIVELLKRVNVVASIYKRSGKGTLGGIVGPNKRQIVSRRNSYSVAYSNHSFKGNNKGRFGRNSHFECPFAGHPVQIKKIEPYVCEYVYDISIDDDKWQTFVASSFLVHNTATAFRSDDEERLTLFEQKIVDYSPAEALKDKNVVVPWRPVFWEGPGDVSIDDACIQMTDDAKGPGLYNARSIADAIMFADKLKALGRPSEAIHSRQSTEHQNLLLEGLKTGKLKSLVHCSLLTTGVDFPWLRWLCMRRFVQSRVRFCQETGRILRYWMDPVTGEEKLIATLYDPNGLIDIFNMSYEEALGGTSLVSGEDDDKKRLNQAAFDAVEHASRALAGLEAFSSTPLNSYLSELICAFDLTGMISRQIASRSWRAMPCSPKQSSVAQALIRFAEGKFVPAAHRKALTLLTESAPVLTRGGVSDLVTVLTALAEKRMWPDLTSLETSAEDALDRRERILNPPNKRQPANVKLHINYKDF